MTIAFSFEQQAVIEGSLLGDAHLSKLRSKNSNSYFQKCQTAKRREYLNWTHDLLGDYSSSVNEYDNWAIGKKYRKAQLISKAHPEFTKLRQRWYPEGVKIVPRDLVLTPFSISIWFFDDGSNDFKGRSCKFATHSFEKQDCEFLCNQLARYNVSAYVGNRNVIHTHASSYKNMIDLVSPYMIWPFFEHKIRYRDSELSFTTSDEANEIQKLYDEGWRQVDIAEKIGKSLSVISNVLRGNLRVSSKGKRNLSLSNTSGIKGVSWDKSRNKWKAFKKLNGKNKHLGRFNTKEEAELAVLGA